MQIKTGILFFESSDLGDLLPTGKENQLYAGMLLINIILDHYFRPTAFGGHN